MGKRKEERIKNRKSKLHITRLREGKIKMTDQEHADYMRSITVRSGACDALYLNGRCFADLLTALEELLGRREDEAGRG